MRHSTINRYRGGGGPVSPSSAVAAAGFTNLKFNDDFTSAATIASSGSVNQTAGINWYWSWEAVTTGSYSMNTTGTAAGVSNGNTGGGAHASSAGGILTITGPGYPNATLCTVAGREISIAPAAGTGNWQYCGFECYMQFNPVGNTSTVASTSGWPAWWTWDVQDSSTIGFGQGPTGGAGTQTEFDIMECFGTIEWGGIANPTGFWGSAIHYPAGTTTTASTGATAPTYVDSNWHLFSVVWKAGSITSYIDNVSIGTMNTTTACPNLDSDNQRLFMILGTGIGWPLNIDYVRVWQ